MPSGFMPTSAAPGDPWVPFEWDVGIGMGPTSERPSFLNISDRGVQYLDTDLDPDGALITWNGTIWVNADGTPAPDDGSGGGGGGGGTVTVVPPPVSYLRDVLGVAWVEDLTFLCSAGAYVLQGTQKTVNQTPLTLATADATHDRIDVFVVTSSGTWAIVQGTPATPAVKPDLDPETQLEVTFCFVRAGATEPEWSPATVNIYNEGTEWTDSRSGTPINLTSTNNPYLGTVCIEATAAVTGNYARFVAPAPINLADYNNLIFVIDSKAAWASTRQLNIAWYQGNTQRGTAIPLRTGNFGFNSSTVGTYQQIVIPLRSFVADGLPVDRLQITVGGTGASMGWFIDDIKLQGGLATETVVSGLTWEGVWLADRQYAARSLVNHLGGVYASIRANVAATPASSPLDWEQVMAPPVTPLKKLSFAASDETTDLEVADDIITLRADEAMTLFQGHAGIRASVNVAPTGANMSIDIKVNGVSILSTKITIEVGETTSTLATVPPVITSAAIADNDLVQVSVLAVGSTVKGAGLKIQMRGT